MKVRRIWTILKHAIWILSIFYIVSMSSIATKMSKIIKNFKISVYVTFAFIILPEILNQITYKY